MKHLSNYNLAALLLAVFVISLGCASSDETETASNASPVVTTTAPTSVEPAPSPSPAIPNLQSEILDGSKSQTASPLGLVDFKNFTYPLPRGWQNPDSADATLVNGRLEPVSADTDLGMDPGVIAERKSKRRIGMSYVTTKFMDVTGDGEDEAIVILKVETTGSAIPQIVYIFTRSGDSPALIWSIRTGDRSDGGLKNFWVENGELVVELFGQDRFLLGGSETGKITGDKEQICCPTFFTRTRYKWNGKNFQLQGKRLTYSVADPSSAPTENMGEIVNAKQKSKK